MPLHWRRRHQGRGRESTTLMRHCLLLLDKVLFYTSIDMRGSPTLRIHTCCRKGLIDDWACCVGEDREVRIVKLGTIDRTERGAINWTKRSPDIRDAVPASAVGDLEGVGRRVWGGIRAATDLGVYRRHSRLLGQAPGSLLELLSSSVDATRDDRRIDSKHCRSGSGSLRRRRVFFSKWIRFLIAHNI